MAAFSYQELPFILDSMITPELMMKLASSSSSTSTTTTNSPLLSPSCFSEDQSHLLNSNYPESAFEQLEFQYPFENLVEFHQDQANPINFNQNGGEKEIQKWVPVKNKRKPKGDGSSPKGVRGGRSKKQKKCNNEGVIEEEEGRKKIKEEKKVNSGEEPPKGYIHVRARRGQATDSHSLAERVRREKISERMKFLQALVPGCDKVTGKATMLDEIINYVQSLQNQVEFLSMKLASVSPMVYSFGVDLDALLLEQQGLSHMSPSVPTTNRAQSPPTAPAAATGPLARGPAFLEEHVQNARVKQPCPQDNVYWELGDQGESDPTNQTGYYNNNNNNNNVMY